MIEVNRLRQSDGPKRAVENSIYSCRNIGIFRVCVRLFEKTCVREEDWSPQGDLTRLRRIHGSDVMRGIRTGSDTSSWNKFGDRYAG